MLVKFLLFLFISTSTTFGYIIGGVDVENNEKYPFIVKLPNGCAGAIVDEYWVLTAGHCDKGLYNVIAGEIDLRNIIESKVNDYAQYRNIFERIKHPGYKRLYNPIISTNENDFLLIRLNKSFDFNSPNVSKIKVADELESLEFLKSKEYFKVIGWGATDSSGYGDSNLLQELDVPYIPYDISNGSAFYSNLIDPSLMFTAGFVDGGKDSCRGDSGGPLFKNIKGQNILFGIVSGGKGCAQKNKPGVYAKVSSIKKWIKEVLEGNYFCNINNKRLDILTYNNQGEKVASVKIGDGPVYHFQENTSFIGNKKLYKNIGGDKFIIYQNKNLSLKLKGNGSFNCSLQQHKFD